MTDSLLDLKVSMLAYEKNIKIENFLIFILHFILYTILGQVAGLNSV